LIDEPFNQRSDVCFHFSCSLVEMGADDAPIETKVKAILPSTC